MSSLRFGRPKLAVTLTHGASATTVTSATQNANGLIMEVITTTPAAVDSSATMTVSIADIDGNVIYTKASLAANTTTKDLLAAGSQVPLSGPYTVTTLYSAAQTTADRTASVVILIDRG